MFNLKSLSVGATTIAVGLSFPATAAFSETVLRVQTVISAKADEVVMLRDFAADVFALTDGEVRFEILPAGSVVGVRETLDAVDAGLIDGGFAWTHY